MPRITGSDAKQYFIPYESDIFEGSPLARVVYKKRFTARHIHWYTTINGGPPSTTGLADLPVLPKEIRARKFRLSNGVKGRYLVWPHPDDDKWKLDVDTVYSSASYALDDEGAGWKITGRIGEKDSRPTSKDYVAGV
jgi:hypothetical protein